MRLIDIVEALDEMSKWNQQLTKIAASNPDWKKRTDTPAVLPSPEAEEAEYQRYNKMYNTVKRATKLHKEQFNGKRWPELEQAYLGGWAGHMLVQYLDSLTEPWPEGDKMVAAGVDHYYGSNEDTVKYALKKGLEIPAYGAYYTFKLSPKALRRHLQDRLNRFEADKQAEMAKPPKPKPKPANIVNPDALDDEDEFQKRMYWQRTVKQFQNRIDTIKRVLALTDDQLKEMVLSNRPTAPSVREALGLPWAPPSLKAYLDKYPSVVSNIK